MEANNEGNGWIVKLPYVTNSRVRVCKSIEAILLAIEGIRNRVFNGDMPDIPYVMIQPRMANNYEYKIVCFNMVPQYIGMTKKGYGRAFAKGPESRAAIMAFAGHAARSLHMRCPEAIVDGLLRVDIFITCPSRGSRFIVNEFESVEADFSNCDHNMHSQMCSKVSRYWHNKIAYEVDRLDEQV
jgi:hypothetical protein